MIGKKLRKSTVRTIVIKHLNEKDILITLFFKNSIRNKVLFQEKNMKVGRKQFIESDQKIYQQTA
jgi:hypothetical protein